eukprot:93950_1
MEIEQKRAIHLLAFGYASKIMIVPDDIALLITHFIGFLNELLMQYIVTNTSKVNISFNMPTIYSNVSSKCNRLLDYYIVIACADHTAERCKRRLCRASIASPHETESRYSLFSMRPKIINRYPTKDHSDTPLLPWVIRAAMPHSYRARTMPPSPKFFIFTGWNIDGNKLYGACLRVFRKMNIKKQRQPVYLPKTLVLLSHYPFFCIFDVFLKYLWMSLQKVNDIRSYHYHDISALLLIFQNNSFSQKRLPHNFDSLNVSLKSNCQYDMPVMDIPWIGNKLSVDIMCAVLKLLLLEKAVIFVDNLVNESTFQKDKHYFNGNTCICELFISLLFPLRWRHLFISSLCHQIMD